MEEKDYINIGKFLSGEDKEAPKGEDLTSLTSVWDNAGSYRFEEESGNDAAWAKMQLHINAAPVLKVSWIKRNQWAVAASVALLAVAGSAFWMLTKPAAKTEFAAIHETTGNKQVKTLNLPDGSKIVMNSNSEITVAAGFNENSRNITLKGEANFEVAPNANLPFIVTAGKTTTRVVGTGFDISAFDGEDVQIIVTHGKVKFAGTSSDLMLTRGQAAKFDHENAALERMELNNNSLAWQNEDWIFKSVKLEEIAIQIKHRFGKTLKYDASNSNKVFTGKFAGSTSAEDIAKTISEALQIPVTIE